MRKFKYEMHDVGIGCATVCPFSTNVHISSTMCHVCKYFVADNVTTKVVVCDCPDKLVCKDCGKKHETQESYNKCTCKCEHNWEYEFVGITNDLEVMVHQRCRDCSVTTARTYTNLKRLSQNVLEQIYND
jgi:hypothetical protein